MIRIDLPSEQREILEKARRIRTTNRVLPTGVLDFSF
jgi:hypothetical protein